jgi:hypothetical protein
MSGFNNNYKIKDTIYGNFFDKLNTKYIHPMNIRNARGETAVNNFDKMMKKYNTKFYIGDDEKYRMTFKHWNGFGWLDSEIAFYPDRVLGINEEIFVEIKSALTDTHHPAKILLEATSCKLKYPQSQFFVYCDSEKPLFQAKKLLEECPLIDGVIIGPTHLEDWVKNGFKKINTGYKVKPVNFFK